MRMTSEAAIASGLDELNATQLLDIKKNCDLTETELKFLMAHRRPYNKNATLLLNKLLLI